MKRISLLLALLLMLLSLAGCMADPEALEPDGSMAVMEVYNFGINFPEGVSEAYSHTRELVAGQLASACFLSTGGLVSVTISGPDGQEVASGEAPAIGQNFCLMFTAGQTGDYTASIAVQPAAPVFYNGMLNLLMEKEDPSAGLDNDSPARAEDLSAAFIDLPGGMQVITLTGNQSVDDPADVYRVELLPGQPLSVSLWHGTPGALPVLALVDEEGNTITAAQPVNSPGSNVTFQLSFSSSDGGGPLYFRIDEDSVPVQPFTYILTVTRGGKLETERNDSLTSAIWLAPGQPALGHVGAPESVNQEYTGLLPDELVQNQVDLLSYGPGGSLDVTSGAAIPGESGDIEFFQPSDHALLSLQVGDQVITAPDLSFFGVRIHNRGSQSYLTFGAYATEDLLVFRRIHLYRDARYALVETGFYNRSNAPIEDVTLLEELNPSPASIMYPPNPLTINLHYPRSDSHPYELAVASVVDGYGAIGMMADDPSVVLSFEQPGGLRTPAEVAASPISPVSLIDPALAVAAPLGDLPPGEIVTTHYWLHLNSSTEELLQEAALTYRLGHPAADTYWLEVESNRRYTIDVLLPAYGLAAPIRESGIEYMFGNRLDPALELVTADGDVLQRVDLAGEAQAERLTFQTPAILDGSLYLRIIAANEFIYDPGIDMGLDDDSNPRTGWVVNRGGPYVVLLQEESGSTLYLPYMSK